MTPTATRTGIPADLIERVMTLSPEQQDELAELIALADLPPDPMTDDEFKIELARRVADVQAGRAVLLTREEADEQVRKTLREQHGFEL